MEALLRVVFEFIAELLHGVVEGIIYFDSPARLRPTEQAALQKRTAPYRGAAHICIFLYFLLLFTLILWVCAAQHLPLHGFLCVMLGLLIYLAAIGALAALRSKLSRGLWRMADFHAAVARCLGLGARGFAIALVLLHLPLLCIALAVNS